MKLLDNIRGRDELEIILNKTGKEDEEKYVRLARVDLALKYSEKPVIYMLFLFTPMINAFYFEFDCVFFL